MTMNYGSQALGSQDGVQLVIALYDGMVRFLNQAEDALRAGDRAGMKDATRRVIKIVAHLQSRLLPDTDVSASISEYYASLLALVLEAVRTSSPEKMRDAQGCVFNMRDAWKQVAAAA